MLSISPDQTAPARPAQWLSEALVAARLFDPMQLKPYLAEFRSASGPATDYALAQFLVEAGLLSKYQAERTLAGEANRLALGPYVLVEPIGSGSLGTVFQAIGRSDRKRYAVKVLPLRSLWNVHLAKQQVLVFHNLPAHPAVVPFVDVDTAGGFHYMAWPYVMGQTLAQIVRTGGPRPTEQVIRVAAQVAEGLLLCHTHDVSHGLLKPSNILIGNDGQARLLDLGIGAVLSENISDDESMLDTISTANSGMAMLDYAAPETLNSPTLRTPAGDIYSLGCTLYFLLTGGMPFPDGNAVDKILAHQTQKPRAIRKINPTVPQWLEALTMQMMGKAEGERPATADVLAAFLSGDYSVPTPSRVMPSPLAEVAAAPPPAPLTNSTPWLRQPDPRAVAAETMATLETNVGTDPSLNLMDKPESDPTDPLLGSSGQLLPPPPSISAYGAVTPATANRFRLKNAATESLKLDDMPTDLPTPIQYTPTRELAPRTDFAAPAEVPPPPLPPFARSWFHRLLKQFQIWKPHTDLVQLSVFGPPVISPGDSVMLQVFAHTPDAFESVQTLSKVFHQNGELLATGFVQREVRHGQKLGIHLGVVNGGVERSEAEMTWRGQPQPRMFDLHVPWESPAGPSPTVLSAGLDHVLAGRIAFTLQILPRKA